MSETIGTRRPRSRAFRETQQTMLENAQGFAIQNPPGGTEGWQTFFRWKYVFTIIMQFITRRRPSLANDHRQRIAPHSYVCSFVLLHDTAPFLKTAYTRRVLRGCFTGEIVVFFTPYFSTFYYCCSTSSHVANASVFCGTRMMATKTIYYAWNNNRKHDTASPTYCFCSCRDNPCPRADRQDQASWRPSLPSLCLCGTVRSCAQGPMFINFNFRLNITERLRGFSYVQVGEVLCHATG